MNKVKHLPDGELEVMQIIWRLGGSVSRADIEAAMGEEHRPAPTTILTVLTRLREKGFLAMERRERTNAYTPLVSEREYLASESRSLLDKLYGGSLGAFAVSLCDSGISREEIDQLRQLLERGKL